ARSERVDNSNVSQKKGSLRVESSSENPIHEIVFRADVSVRDGRYANNPWLQELPRQFSKLVWDNAALISPQLAKRENLENGDVIDLSYRDRTLRAPVWIQPGQAEHSVTLPLGYGRKVAGHIAQEVGFN